MKTSTSSSGGAHLADFLEKREHGWAALPAGLFRCWHWTGSGPPRWSLGSRHFADGDRLARAFLGIEPYASLRLVTQSLQHAARFLQGAGIVCPADRKIPVVLWDPAFPLPPMDEFGGWDALGEPLTFIAPPSIVIALPTYHPALRGPALVRWVRSAVLHEAFHAALWSWLGVKPAARDAERLHWKKFEEMCAVALEYRLAPKNGAWMDYGRKWQAALALSHHSNEWPDDLDQFFRPGPAKRDEGESPDPPNPINFEEYAHFPLLAWMDEAVWPHVGCRRHWLVESWDTVRRQGWRADPWQALDAALESFGGLAEVFRRYAVEAIFPTSWDHVLGRIHRAFGPPPAVVLQPGMPVRTFVMGRLAVHYFRIDAKVGQPTHLQITDELGQGAEVRAFGPTGQEITGLKSSRRVKAITWDIRVPAAKAGEQGLVVSVCQPHYDRGSVVFTAGVL